jgi:hypothetical protein
MALYPRPQNMPTHEYVTWILAKIPAQGNTVSRLKKLKRLRTVADYDMSPSNPLHQDWANNWNEAEILADSLHPDLSQL